METIPRRVLLILAMVMLPAASPSVAQEAPLFEGQPEYGYPQSPFIEEGPSDLTSLAEQTASATDQSLWTESLSERPLDVGPAVSRSTVDGNGYCCPPCWYWEQNVRILTRNRVRKGLFSFDQAGVPQLTTRSVGFDVAPGYDATVGHYLGRDSENRDQFVEFTYWGMNAWMEERQANATLFLTDSFSFPDPVTFGNLFSSFDSTVGGFNRVDRQFIAYGSDIHNFELNARIRPRGRPDRMVLYPNGKWRRERQQGQYKSYLLGLRVMSIDEFFGFYGRGTIINGAVSNDVSGDYLIDTHNDMVGIQVGGDLMFRGRLWSWGARYKVAPMINFCDQISRISTNAAGDPFASADLDVRRQAKRSDLAAFGEVGIAGSYKIRPNMVLHASYDFMFAVGMALAPEQLEFSSDPVPRVNDNGFLYYHGLSLGLECIW